MPLNPGSRFGAYEVVGPLGAGGMGEVYRARDTTLDRQVALKVLPDLWAKDEDRLARFDREARVLASINHPNIAAIYGRERAGGVEALVLEFVEGPALDELVNAGPVPVDDALRIARQVALALEAAHAQGILHRDLKPANLKIRPDGTVKVLDFGLAKSVGPGPAGPDGPGLPASAATVTSPMTEIGMVLGTPAYMAPEQAKGRRVDARADVWAFGCVLFEMLTGRRAFEGEDVTETLAAIVRGEPDWSALPADTPPRVRRLLRRCLTKDWAQRLHDIGDARLELEDAAEDAGARRDVAGDRRGLTGREVIAWAVALAAIAAGGWAVWPSVQSNPAVPAMQFQLAELELSSLFSRPVDFVLSPDGQHLVFSARPTGSAQPTLWIRSLSSTDVRPLTGTEGGTVPFWSPDSRTIAFAAHGQLRKIGIDGGLPQKIADVAPTAGGSWSAGGTIVFAERSHLYRVPASGGTAEQISTDAEVEAHGRHYWPAFLPDGRHFITVRADSEDAVLFSLDSMDRQPLFSTSSKVVPVAAGYLLFVRDSVLLAQPFDLTRRAVTGEAIPVAENIFTISFTGNARGGSADFDASANGTLFHRAGGDPDSQIAWFDRSGKRLGIVPGPIAGYAGVALSPDASQLTFHLHTSKGGDIHVIELARGAQSQITFQEGQHASAAFWIGNDRVGFTGLRQRKSELFFTRVPPVDRQQTLIAEVGGSAAASNGTEVIWNRDGGLWMARLDSSAPPIRIAPGSYPHFSPDGNWISYQSNASGRTEIYVQPLAPGSQPLRVSTEGGNKARWGRDGKELFFLSPDGRLMAATLRLAGTPTVLSGPTELFTPDFRCFTCAFVPYEPGPDNQRFLILANVQEGRRIEPATLVFDWVRTLQR